MTGGRSAAAIVQDFVAAERHLHGIAADWSARQFKPGDITDAAKQIEGLRVVLAELRQEARR